MRRRVLPLALAAALVAVNAASANADSTSNPTAQYRTFACTDGHAYTGWFSGPGASFQIVGSTAVFAIREITLSFPSGQVATYDYGVQGFDPSSLITCQYTDPQGVVTTFSGWLTPRA